MPRSECRLPSPWLASFRHTAQAQLGAHGEMGCGPSGISWCCRYEREFGRGHRAVLRKVLEQDEGAGLPMVLCIAAILQPPPGAGLPCSAIMTLPACCTPPSHAEPGSTGDTQRVSACMRCIRARAPEPDPSPVVWQVSQARETCCCRRRQRVGCCGCQGGAGGGHGRVVRRQSHPGRPPGRPAALRLPACRCAALAVVL